MATDGEDMDDGDASAGIQFATRLSVGIKQVLELVYRQLCWEVDIKKLYYSCKQLL